MFADGASPTPASAPAETFLQIIAEVAVKADARLLYAVSVQRSAISVAHRLKLQQRLSAEIHAPALSNAVQQLVDVACILC